MTARRFAGWFVTCTMLHLSAVAGDTACATHAAQQGHGSRAMAGMPMPDDHAVSRDATPAGVPQRAPKQHPCGTPTSANCCALLASCGTTFTSVRRVAFRAVAVRVSISPTTTNTPLSAVLTLEPPPPRA
jgi:hypothetical protein